jgi:DNA-binding transcriptional LysR family regulator
VDWFPSIEASSADLIEAYVVNGLGIGVSVAIPKKILPPNVRALPLRGFPPVVVGVMWRGRMTSLMQAFLEVMKLSAQRLA